MYRYTVTINKKFTEGMLMGLESREAVKFATWQAAEDYRQWAAEHMKVPVDPCAGSNKYTIECAILEAC
jgi:hypothetical protein